MSDPSDPGDKAAAINWRGITLGVVVSFLALFAGVLGSLYSDDIKNAVPFCFFDRGSVLACNGEVSWHAVFFWLSALLATGLFLFAQYDSESRRTSSAVAAERERRTAAAQTERARQEAAKNLSNAADELKDLIRTVPPEDFLVAFENYFRGCTEARLAVLAANSVTPETIAKAIRVVCAAVAALAQNFDHQKASVLYAVNVMRYLPSKSWSDDEVRDIKSRLRFAPGIDPRSLRGVLDLQLELSTSTKGPGYEPDTDLIEIALPIPEQETAQGNDKGKKKWRVLPGAPLAFCLNRPELYQDTTTLAKWCEEQGAFDGLVIDQIRDYFEHRVTTVRSLVALPLTRMDGIGERIGVLNIHSELPGLLNAERVGELFVPIIVPFRAMLIDLLDAWVRAKDLSPRGSR